MNGSEPIVLGLRRMAEAYWPQVEAYIATLARGETIEREKFRAIVGVSLDLHAFDDRVRAWLRRVYGGWVVVEGAGWRIPFDGELVQTVAPKHEEQASKHHGHALLAATMARVDQLSPESRMVREEQIRHHSRALGQAAEHRKAILGVPSPRPRLT